VNVSRIAHARPGRRSIGRVVQCVMQCFFRACSGRRIGAQLRRTIPMDIQSKATSIDLFSLKTRPMQAFCMRRFIFFLSFSTWLGLAPLRRKALSMKVRNVQ